jgi:hypothetical protein
MCAGTMSLSYCAALTFPERSAACRKVDPVAWRPRPRSSSTPSTEKVRNFLRKNRAAQVNSQWKLTCRSSTESRVMHLIDELGDGNTDRFWYHAIVLDELLLDFL